MGYGIIYGMRKGIILGVIGAVILAIVGVTIWKQNQPEVVEDSTYDYETIREMAAGMQVDEVKTWENMKGGTGAPVVIEEFADYQCSHCAEMNEYLNKLIDEYDGKVALVFRTYVLPYSNNGVQAAAAANAAAKQGYWTEMKDILFENQGAWYNLREEKFQEKLGEYFMMASERQGDREKFFEDMKSEEVRQKIAYDMAKGMKAGLQGTPWFLLNGEWVENQGVSPTRYVAQLREKINAELKKTNE